MEKPYQRGALHVWGLVVLVGRRYPEALEMIERASSLDTSEGLLFIWLGVIHAMNGQPQKAVEPIQRASTLLPNHYDVHFNLALALKELDRDHEAEVSLRHAV